MTLTNKLLTVFGVSSWGLSGLTNAQLTGGFSANTFTLGGWTGTATLTGGGGGDIVAATADTNFTLTDGSLSATNGLSVTLVGIGIANLTGGKGANTFNLSGWHGLGSLSGISAKNVVDSLIVSRDADFNLSDSQLTLSDGMSMRLVGLKSAHLTGLASTNIFLVIGWTGAIVMDRI